MCPLGEKKNILAKSCGCFDPVHGFIRQPMRFSLSITLAGLDTNLPLMHTHWQYLLTTDVCVWVCGKGGFSKVTVSQSCASALRQVPHAGMNIRAEAINQLKPHARHLMG